MVLIIGTATLAALIDKPTGNLSFIHITITMDSLILGAIPAALLAIVF